MSWFNAFILGLIQGIAEFLPISSSGHLVLAQKLLGIQQHDLELDIVVHVGTLLSIVTYYHKDLLKIFLDTIKSAVGRKMTPGFRLMLLMFVGSIPTAIIGLVFREQFKSLFSSVPAVGFFLCVTAAFLYFTKNKGGDVALRDVDSNLPDISIKKAIIIGVAQGFAIAPGISRAGATISAALYSGVSRASAARFSFLLSIPAVFGAAVLELRDADFSSQSSLYLWIALVFSYIFGLIGLTLIVKIVSHGKLQIFSGYLLVIGVLAMLSSYF